MTAWLIMMLLAQPAPDLRRLFPWRADVQVQAGNGLATLALPPSVLEKCGANAADVRLVSASGREVPYALQVPQAPAATSTSVQAKVLDAARHVETPPKGAARYVERYDVTAPEGDGPWQLAITAARPSFVRQVSLVSGAAGVRASVFRLPNLPAKLSVPLPTPLPPGKPLVVTLTGEEGYLTPGLTFVRDDAAVEAAPTQVSLTTRETTSSHGHTRYVLDRPPGVSPAGLRLSSQTPAFQRRAEVTGAGKSLGDAALVRLGADATRAENLDIPIAAASGNTLVVDIDDGDSPPLQAATFSALVRLPRLVFSAGAAPLSLYFGGNRVFAPRYDLQDLRLEASVQPPQASLGASVVNPLFVPDKALAFAMHPGAQVTPGVYSHVRLLTIGNAPEGISALVLEGTDLAASRAQLRDVRVVDADDHGWPFIVEPRAHEAWEPVALTPLAPERGVSRWRLALPPGGGFLDALSVDADTAFIERPWTLRRKVRDADDVDATGTLQRRKGDRAPLELSFDAVDTVEAELRIEDGDDGPLPLRAARAHLQAPVLYIAAAPGPYRLLLGAQADSAPAYELAAARDVVLAVQAPTIKAGPLSDNPARSWRAQLGAQMELTQVVVWGALLLIVAGLGMLTLRLARAS